MRPTSKLCYYRASQSHLHSTDVDPSPWCCSFECEPTSVYKVLFGTRIVKSLSRQNRHSERFPYVECVMPMRLYILSLLNRSDINGDSKAERVDSCRFSLSLHRKLCLRWQKYSDSIALPSSRLMHNPGLCLTALFSPSINGLDQRLSLMKPPRLLQTR